LDNFAEKRKFIRFTHKQPVEFQFHDAGCLTGSLTGDLSAGGLRILLNDFIPLNTELMLHIWLDDGRVVESVGRVAWVRKNRFNDNYQAGLEFSANQSIQYVQKTISGHFLGRLT